MVMYLYTIILMYDLNNNTEDDFKNQIDENIDKLKKKTRMIIEFDKCLHLIGGEKIIYNTWNMIININKKVINQITNFNYVLESSKIEKDILNTKKEIILSFDNSDSIKSKYEIDDTYNKILQFMSEYKLSDTNDNIDNELKIFDIIDKSYDKYKKIKDDYIERTIKFPNDKSTKIDDYKVEVDTTTCDSNETEISTQDVIDFTHKLKEYYSTISKSIKEFKDIIHHKLALEEAKKHNIEVFDNITCRNSGLFSFNSSKTYDAKVLDIVPSSNYDNTLLKLKLEGKDEFHTVSLKDCYSNHELGEDETHQKHNKEAEEHASKLGFQPNASVICSPKLSMWEKYWNKLSPVTTQGKITKFISYKDRSNRNRIKVVLDNNKSFLIENCKPEYNYALDSLDDVKKSKYMKKQLDKLKLIIKQIESLNPVNPDYELRLNILNKEYDRIKNETSNSLQHSSSEDPKTLETKGGKKPYEESDENLQDQLKLLKMSQDLEKFKSTRIKLEKVLRRVNPKAWEIEHPEYTKIPKNLRTSSGVIKDALRSIVVGGHQMIQHAGANHYDYNQLKENINNVSLESILNESNSILNQLNKFNS